MSSPLTSDREITSKKNSTGTLPSAWIESENGVMGRMRVLGVVALVVAGSWGALRPGSAQAQGVFLPGSGATHRSMAGASTAGGVDALGALYWNPAAISRLPGSE